ncbi:MAG: hypothetical protein ACJ75H_16515 [Thermoanaerobaculia bacterium]
MAESDRDFVDALVEDPANPPQLQVLTGYRGRSAEEGHTRLYLDPELTGWVDIPDEAILLTREVQDEYGLGKSLVWTKLDAQLKQGPQTGGGTGADFLRGQVAQDLGGGAGLGGAQPIRTLIGCPTHAPFLCPVTPPRLCPKTCAPKTLTPEECPTLGITCTALPPQCPQRTFSPEQCPTFGFTCTALPPQCPQRTFSPEQCPSLGIACTALPPCPTRDVAQCIPQPTSSPQFCPVATPVGGCPGGGIGDPGGPVEFGQGQFGGQAFNAQVQGIGPVTQFCPRPTPPFTIQQQCLQTIGGPQCQPTLRDPACWQPVTRQGICVIQTRPEICRPMSPWCPWTPITETITTGPTTTPFGGGGFGGGGFGGGQFGGGAQGFAGVQGGGMEAAGLGQQQIQPTAICPVQTQFCPAPNTAQLTCPVTHNIQCFTSRMCPRSQFCPSVAIPCQTWICGPTMDCPFGGGGFGGGF